MRIYDYEEVEVQRDMDLVRELLLKLEVDPRMDGKRWVPFSTPEDLGIAGHSVAEVVYHLNLLMEAGFLRGKSSMSVPELNKLTWQGHEFLDDIRDDTIWGKTKERLRGLSGVGIALVWELAKAELKHKLGLP